MVLGTSTLASATNNKSVKAKELVSPGKGNWVEDKPPKGLRTYGFVFWWAKEVGFRQTSPLKPWIFWLCHLGQLQTWWCRVTVSQLPDKCFNFQPLIWFYLNPWFWSVDIWGGAEVFFCDKGGFKFHLHKDINCREEQVGVGQPSLHI